MANAIKVPHTCPKCGKTAKTIKELEELFGFRNMENKELRNQSWCRECRSKH